MEGTLNGWESLGCDDFNGSPAEVSEDAGVHAKLPQSPPEIKLLASFLDNGVGV